MQLTTSNVLPCTEESQEYRTTTMDTARNTEAKQCLCRTTASKENNTLPLANYGPIIEGGMKSKQNILEDNLL